MTSPYENRPERTFWRPAVADRHLFDFTGIARERILGPEDVVATAGSCFAQHFGNRLQRVGARYLELETAPADFTPEEARRHGFGVYSCRYGNIYSARQLFQIAQEALGQRSPVDAIWTKDGRFYDALRPSVDPVGHTSAEDVRILRSVHLAAVTVMLQSLDVLVFTLGLTEAWESREDGTVYPTAPETVAGTYDPARYAFHNFRYPEIRADLEAFWTLLRSVNPTARLLLTVSPVPLTATATDDHVLVATTYSKSTLRAVAGDLAADHEGISYFPSYELIASHPIRGSFFNPDLRTVNDRGVDYVMSHFFAAQGWGQPATNASKRPDAAAPTETPALNAAQQRRAARRARRNGGKAGGNGQTAPRTIPGEQFADGDDDFGLVCDEEELEQFIAE